MPKNLKLYVPVVTRKGPTSPVKVTLVGIHNCTELPKEIPTPKDLFLHIQSQSKLMAEGGKFSSLKVRVTQDRFLTLQKELSQKAGGSYRSPIIDVVFDLQHLPVVQIIPTAL